MDSDYQDLVSLFNSDPKIAVEKSQKIISSVSNFDSYKDFYSYHLQNAHISTCPNEWSSSQLCIYCRDCAVINPACICLQCFLKGNHEGHNYVILNSPGNCDCGDLSQWKREGCCQKHRGLPEEDNHPEDYLDEKLRTTLTDIIFKAAFTALLNFSQTNSPNISIILEFISSFLKFGDGFRRLIAQALTEKIDLEKLLLHIPEYSMFFNQSLQQLCGGLVNDQLFIRNFSIKFYSSVLNGIIKDTPNCYVQDKEECTYKAWNSFYFYSFGEKVVKYNILQRNWDWVSFFTECLPYFKDLFDYIKSDNFSDTPHILVIISLYLSKVTIFQPNEQTQLLLDNIATKILSCGSKKSIMNGSKENNTIIVTSFNEETQRNDYFPFVEFILHFSEIYEAFKKKPNLKFDKLIEELDKSLDISALFSIGQNSIGNGNGSENENDKFVTRYLNREQASHPSTYYKSFHNGGSFLLSHPLLFTLASLFRNDNNTRIKISRLLAMEKYQNLRIRICIACMKTILSNICKSGSLTSDKNFGALFTYFILNRENLCTQYFTRIFPLFQLLIGLHCPSNSINEEFSLKEFFAFESAREIGLFDDFSSIDYEDENISEKQKQMIFSFLYVSLLLTIERTLFNYIGNDFIQEQIIFEMKKGVHSIEELGNLYDKSAISAWSHLWIFNYILMKIATTNKKEETAKNNNNNAEEEEDNDDGDNENSSPAKSYNQNVSFYLKDDAEWKPISAINSLNDQMALMNNEISKDSSKLLKINSFEPEESYFYHPRKLCKDEILDALDIEDESCSSDDLHVRLKHFLFTPTVLAVVYNTLRTNAGIDSPNSDLNDHLAMNILVLISRFIKEEEEEEENGAKNNSPSFDESTIIQYDNLVDLISKLKQFVFNYHLDKDGNAFIENTLNKSTFVSLLKLKIGSTSSNLQPKSFIEVLLQKGKLGRTVLDEISLNVHSESLNKESDKEVVDEKEIKHQRAKKLKEQIMNHYKNAIANYSASDHLQQKGTDSIDDATNSASITDREVCSICSMYKKDEIFSYPLYIYRTKFPFIVDKPPTVGTETVGDISIDDNEEDFEQENKKKQKTEKDDDEKEEEEETVSTDEVMSIILNNFPQLTETEGLSEEEAEEREKTFQIIFNTLMSQQINRINLKKQSKNLKNKAKETQIKENKEHKELKDKSKENCKRCTAGANFILQFGICQHNVHPSCVKTEVFTCPIDRSIKNGLLPCIDGIDPSIILNGKEDDMLSKSAVDSINSFLTNFASFFECTKRANVDIFVELVKSISGLISTYEIRLRNLPDSLDNAKNSILARNLFLTAWYGYRIKGKPKMTLYNRDGTTSDDVECRMSTFQRFIKRLIECDSPEAEINKIASSLAKFIGNDDDDNDDLERSEKEACLFLRRVCLADFFLLKGGNDSISDIIDWDDILMPSNLATKYKLKFSTIDDDFEFKPFSFMNFPKEFLRFGASPFSFPIEKTEQLLLFNLTDYNFLIDKYDEITGEFVIENDEIEKKKNSLNLASIDMKMIGIFFKSFYSIRHYPSVILMVGKFASQIFVVDQNYYTFLDPFYLDKYGCMDIGYKRSQPLFFNEDKFEKFMDTILSGDFSYYLEQLK